CETTIDSIANESQEAGGIATWLLVCRTVEIPARDLSFVANKNLVAEDDRGECEHSESKVGRGIFARFDLVEEQHHALAVSEVRRAGNDFDPRVDDAAGRVHANAVL